MMRRRIGQYIVRDPAICHGKLTFVGTRILVSSVLRQVAAGMSWQSIIAEWRGSITADAIAEAVSLASRSFAEHADEFALEAEAA